MRHEKDELTLVKARAAGAARIAENIFGSCFRLRCVGLYTRARSVEGLTRDEVVKLSMLLLSPSVASRSKWKSRQRDQISLYSRYGQ